ncbi:outer membrane protein transport protein [Desulfobacterales bacterium HSG16]|nr:outer membrane protein transport protein [Desulfobacterales bacterium HSG16]
MKKILLVSALILLSVSYVHAGSVDTFGIGSKATALGGAYSAYANDPFAVYYNPAGLSQIEGKVIAGGVHMLDPSLTIDDMRVSNTDDPMIKGPNSFSDESPNLFAPHLGYAMPINDKVSFGIAAYAPWGLELEWEEDPAKSPGAFAYTHSWYMREAITPTISYKINDKLFIGFGVSVGMSKAGAEKKQYLTPDVGKSSLLAPALKDGATYQAAQSIAAVEAANQAAGGVVPTITTSTAAYNFLSAYAPGMTAEVAAFQQLADAGLETPEQIGTAQAAGYDGVPATDHGKNLELDLQDDINYSFNIGVMYKPKDTLTLGLTYRSRTDADFEGDVKLGGVKVAEAQLDYDHPDQIQLGARYVPESNQNISVEVDFVWTNWSINDKQYETLSNPVTIQVIPGNPAADVVKTDILSDRKWEDTTQVRVGVEWKASDFLTLRGGFFYDPTPIPDDTLDLQWPDADKKIYTLGCGLNFEKFTVDGVLQYCDIEKARYLGGESDNFNHGFDPSGAYERKVSASADGNIWGAGLTVSYAF